MKISAAGVVSGTLTLLLLVIALPLTRTGVTITADRAQVGRLYESPRVEVADTRHRSYLELPTGRLTIGIDVTPSIQIDDPEASYEKIPLLTPRNGALVRVAWDLDAQSDEVHDGEYGYADRPYSFDSLMLVAGGTRYLLSAGDADSVGSATWSVPGDGTDVRVEATYDRVVQRLDPFTGKRDVGRAAGLYGTSPAKGTCDAPTLERPFAAATSEPNFTCKYQVRRTGYISGAGWAPAGQAWLVVDTLLEPALGEDVFLVRNGTQAKYSVVDRNSVASRLQGREGKPARGEFGDSDYGHAAYWSVPIGAPLPASVTFAQSMTIVPSAQRYERDQDESELGLRWTVPLR